MVATLFIDMWLREDGTIGFQFLTGQEFIAWSAASDFRYSFIGKSFHVYVCTDDVPRARALRLAAQIIARGKVMVRTVNLTGNLEIVSHVLSVSDVTNFLEGNSNV